MSWFSRLNPTPSFPLYTGPYSVGTIDVELAVSDLPSPCKQPEGAPGTVAYRIFYPCETPKKGDSPPKPVRWIPTPQRQNLAALLKFSGIGPRLAEFAAFFPRLIYYITIPSLRNAPLLTPQTKTNKWPVTFFSHGLAGNRNLYSHFCASLSSHGMVVVVPDHRDRSSPLQYVRATATTPAQTIDYNRIPVSETDEAFLARDKQLRIRCWEVANALESIHMLNDGRLPENLDDRDKRDLSTRDILSRFRGQLDLSPGSVTWAGHSFGGATMIQFIKAVYYSDQVSQVDEALITLTTTSQAKAQITPESKLVLLDPWMMPISSPAQSSLKSRPLPCYNSSTSSQDQRKAIALISEGFWAWKHNLNAVVDLLTPPRGRGIQAGQAWYAKGSKHFSQSDFGVLFTWFLEKFAGAAAGHELLEGNVRLVVNMLRGAGVEIAASKGLNQEVSADKVEEEGNIKPVQDGDSDSEELERQLSRPLSNAMPNVVDQNVWIEVPIEHRP